VAEFFHDERRSPSSGISPECLCESGDDFLGSQIQGIDAFTNRFSQALLAVEKFFSVKVLAHPCA
jgi:hypothetical protein